MSPHEKEKKTIRKKAGHLIMPIAKNYPKFPDFQTKFPYIRTKLYFQFNFGANANELEHSIHNRGHFFFSYVC